MFAGNGRFDDAIGLCNSPVDVHEPGGSRAIMDHVGIGYGIPYRTMIPLKINNIIIAGRCISADAIAFGSTRNVPACTMTGEAGCDRCRFGCQPWRADVSDRCQRYPGAVARTQGLARYAGRRRARCAEAGKLRVLADTGRMNIPQTGMDRRTEWNARTRS